MRAAKILIVCCFAVDVVEGTFVPVLTSISSTFCHFVTMVAEELSGTVLSHSEMILMIGCTAAPSRIREGLLMWLIAAKRSVGFVMPLTSVGRGENVRFQLWLLITLVVSLAPPASLRLFGWGRSCRHRGESREQEESCTVSVPTGCRSFARLPYRSRPEDACALPVRESPHSRI